MVDPAGGPDAGTFPSGLPPGASCGASGGASALIAGEPAWVTDVSVASDAGADKTYGLGDTVRMRVDFVEPVEVTGTPRLKIDMDPADWGEKWASYESGSGTGSLIFAHTVLEPNISTQGIAVLANSLELNGGTIRAGGAEANLAHDGLDHDANHKVNWQTASDGGASGTDVEDPLCDCQAPVEVEDDAGADSGPPTVTGVSVVSSPASGSTYMLGETIRIRASFSEAVNVTGSPRLSIDMDPAAWGTKQAAYTSGGGTSSLTFAYTVVEPNYSPQGIAVLANSLALNGGTIRSATANENAALAHTGRGHASGHKVDWRPSISVADARADEGAGATVAFQVSLSRAFTTAGHSVSVNYATSDGTAVAGADYTATSGTLTFAAGETSKTVHVPIIDDSHDEGEETFGFRLSNAAGARMGDGQATGTIANTDPMPRAWLSRFGRTASAHVAGAVVERFRGGSAERNSDSSSTSSFVLGGRRVDGLFTARAPADGGRGRDGRDAPVQRLEGDFPRERMDRTLAGPGHAGGSPFGVPGSAAGIGPFAGHGPAGAGPSVGRNPSDGRSSSAAGRAEAWMLIEGLLDVAGWRAGQDLADGLRLADGYRRADWRDVLAGSSFDYKRTTTPGSESAFGLSRWSAWGHGARTRFSGADGPLSVTGDVTTATLGADARRGRWTAGLALAHSLGQGAYAAGAAAGGDVESTLTSLNPYAHLEINGRTSLWGVLGYGAGELTLTPETAGAAIETDLGNAMAAFGGRGVFARRTGPDGEGGFELAVVSDALLTNTASEAATGLVGAEGRASRVRLMLEGSGSIPLWNGVTLRPTLEAGLRYDGGDAETGAGVEIGGGLGYAAGRVSVDVEARALLAHADAGYGEWGFSGSVTWQPDPDGRGFSMNVGSSWGQAMSGVQTLWDGRPGVGFGAGMTRGAAGDPARRLQTEFGYGFQRRKGEGLLTPFLAAESGDGRAAYRLGLRLDSAANAEAAFEIGRRASPGGPPEDSFRLEGRVRW